MIHTDEDDEFARIEREAELRKGQPYHFTKRKNDDDDIQDYVRPWVGLMEDEAMELALEIIARLDLPPTTKMQVEQQFIHALSNPNSLWMLFAAEIEAKLKEKNVQR